MYKDHDGVWRSYFGPALDAIYILLDMNNDDHRQAFTALYDVTSRIENDYDNAVKSVQALRMELFELKKNK